MLTPQEVSTHVFSKARMGGYNMAMVDEFLDTLTEDYTTLYKENAALKAKLKVLVDKVEEYRATEDSMRATLLTAQKMASQMVQEAEKEKADLLAAAESEMGARKAALEAEIAAESERLRLAKEESAAFIANMRRLCSSELEFLDGVPEIQVSAPSAQAVQDAACAASGAVDRGIASANFVVLRETNMAAVLVETGFMTNVEELTRLCDETYQQKLMEGVARGVGDYLNSLPRK